MPWIRYGLGSGDNVPTAVMMAERGITPPSLPLVFSELCGVVVA